MTHGAKKRVLVVVTSCAKYDNHLRPTGLWLDEVVHFVLPIEAAGYQVDYVSPQGGYTPIDPHSLSADSTTPDGWAWYTNKSRMQALATTLAPSAVKAENYIAIFFAGGHGTVFDFPNCEPLLQLASDIYENGGIVSAVCHGPCGLINIKLRNGEYLVKGKRLTCFSNDEEEVVQLTAMVPFLTQTELEKRGAIYNKGENWGSHVESDNRLITGQNPGSTLAVGETVAKALAAL